MYTENQRQIALMLNGQLEETERLRLVAMIKQSTRDINAYNEAADKTRSLMKLLTTMMERTPSLPITNDTTN